MLTISPARAEELKAQSIARRKALGFREPMQLPERPDAIPQTPQDRARVNIAYMAGPLASPYAIAKTAGDMLQSEMRELIHSLNQYNNGLHRLKPENIERQRRGLPQERSADLEQKIKEEVESYGSAIQSRLGEMKKMHNIIGSVIEEQEDGQLRLGVFSVEFDGGDFSATINHDSAAVERDAAAAQVKRNQTIASLRSSTTELIGMWLSGHNNAKKQLSPDALASIKSQLPPEQYEKRVSGLQSSLDSSLSGLKDMQQFLESTHGVRGPAFEECEDGTMRMGTFSIEAGPHYYDEANTVTASFKTIENRKNTPATIIDNITKSSAAHIDSYNKAALELREEHLKTLKEGLSPEEFQEHVSRWQHEMEAQGQWLRGIQDALAHTILSDGKLFEQQDDGLLRPAKFSTATPQSDAQRIEFSAMLRGVAMSFGIMERRDPYAVTTPAKPSSGIDMSA